MPFNLFTNKKEPKLPVTLEDKAWVEESFSFLIDCFGYPGTESKAVVLNDKFFPESFSNHVQQPQALINDFCTIYNLNPALISFELYEDLRDSTETPYAFEGMPFEAGTAIGENRHKIFIAKSLLKFSDRLAYVLALEFAHILLVETNINFSGGDDDQLFIFLAAIYFDLGLIVASKATDIGSSNSGLWQQSWSYVAQMPEPVIAYTLAIQLLISEQKNEQVWANQLPPSVKKLFLSSVEYLKQNPILITSPQEIEAFNLLKEANYLYEVKEYDEAVKLVHKALLLTQHPNRKAHAYHNLGYYQICLGQYKDSLKAFRTALVWNENEGFSNENMAYALLKLSQPDQAKEFLDRAKQSGHSVLGYSYRNWALYHWQKGQTALAKEYFNKALEENYAVDFLAEDYNEFLTQLNI